ncbi:zinc finger CCCH domain-containing protein 34-like isoform X1 [Lycium barbarum]|uniref:zinc finger CCCH domain-containing protein 34-like isoform X1 n=2 Tax=Lycium barbarum TaxID=112863 RepID=UPI00293F5E9F|nr:zinc finger CCCH domain-containing protein 34-like isoform X1 [Lycium barbarum]
MDEELKKRYTDCVYFLASPLTCKKGMECEYRHSEIARLNPRDCWYWLAGSCLNPTCAFRHPPLESRAETSTEPGPPPNKSAVPVKKTNFPCYFYFNGYCNKGERCSYLHGPDDGTTAWKSSKIASGVPDGPTAEKKISAGSETGPSAVEKHPDSSETGPKAAACEYVKSKVDLHLTTNNVGEQIASHETSESLSEEATAVRLDSLVPAECFSQGESDLSPNQSSDEEVEDNVEREELLESSPGFDVLVDDRVEGLGHEDDHQYMPHHDMEDRELDERFAGYDFENSLEYDPSYPDMRIASDQEQDGSYYNVENHEINEHVREIPIPAHGRQNVPHKRRLSRELPFRSRGNVDLRDLLKRRRGNESDPPNHLSRRFDLSRSNAHEQSRDRYRRPQGSRWMPQRLASKVESNVSFSSGFVESAEHLKKLRQSQGSSYRQQHFKDRRRGRSRPFANEPPRRMTYRERLTEAPKIFNAPKTLAQIREEKRRGREDGDSFERTAPSGVSEREDFSGPKPLSEILKDKRRLGSVVTLSN